MTHASNPSVEDRETDRYLELPGQQASLLGEFQASEEAVSKNKIDGVRIQTWLRHLLHIQRMLATRLSLCLSVLTYYRAFLPGIPLAELSSSNGQGCSSLYNPIIQVTHIFVPLGFLAARPSPLPCPPPLSTLPFSHGPFQSGHVYFGPSQMSQSLAMISHIIICNKLSSPLYL